jgi:Tfp pilus assembly protein PilW
MDHSNKEMHHSKSDGFTLVELLLYISIGVLVIGAIVSFGWNLLYGRIRARTQQEVNQSMRFVAARLSYEIRNATAAADISSSSITFLSSDEQHSPLLIDLSDNRIRLGAGSGGECPFSAPCPLTSSQVQVSELSFTNLSSDSASTNIGFSFSLFSADGRAEYRYDQTYSAAAELRSNPVYALP